MDDFFGFKFQISYVNCMQIQQRFFLKSIHVETRSFLLQNLYFFFEVCKSVGFAHAWRNGNRNGVLDHDEQFKFRIKYNCQDPLQSS